MAARCFKLELAGDVWYGVAFQSEEEREAFLGIRGSALVEQAPALIPSETQERPEPRVGRPPVFDAAIAAAIEQLDLELDRCPTPRAAARLIQRAIARSDPPAPDLRTIERSAAFKGRKCWGRNSNGAKLRRHVEPTVGTQKRERRGSRRALRGARGARARSRGRKG